MSTDFDAYHVWLGIPPKDQPPDHYRLLGIELFESTPDVIEHAADQRMAYLKTFQAGKHSGLSQKLLNEVAAARLCLLSAEKKAVYDKELRDRVAVARKAEGDGARCGWDMPTQTFAPSPLRKPKRDRNVLLAAFAIFGAGMILAVSISIVYQRRIARGVTLNDVAVRPLAKAPKPVETPAPPQLPQPTEVPKAALQPVEVPKPAPQPVVESKVELKAEAPQPVTPEPASTPVVPTVIPPGSVPAPQPMVTIPKAEMGKVEPSSKPVVQMTSKVIPQRIDAELRLAHKDGPYQLVGQVSVTIDGTLLIERGSTILAAPGAKIVAEGKIASYGDGDDFVKFRSASSLNWDSLELLKGNNQFVERFDVRGAMIGLFINARGPHTVIDCLFTQNRIGVKGIAGGLTSFKNCVVANNSENGFLFWGRYFLEQCTVSNNGIGIYTAYHGNPEVKNCEISGNRVGIKSLNYKANTQYTVQASNIVGNLLAVEVKTEQGCQCQGNYWGTSNPRQIAGMIMDGLKAPGKGVVVFTDFERKPVANAGCSLKMSNESNASRKRR